jgi:hypothetical protein
MPALSGKPWRRSSACSSLNDDASAAALLLNVVYIPMAEEPGLVRRFGDDYLA